MALEVGPGRCPWKLALEFGSWSWPWNLALETDPGNWLRILTLETIRDSDSLLGQPKLVYIQLSWSYYDNNWAIELGSIHWHSGTQISGEHVFIRLSPLPSSSHHDLLAAALAREIISYHLYAHIEAKQFYGVVYVAVMRNLSQTSCLDQLSGNLNALQQGFIPLLTFLLDRHRNCLRIIICNQIWCHRYLSNR